MNSSFLRLPIRARRLAALGALALLTSTLVACGGGDGGGTPLLPVAPSTPNAPAAPGDTAVKPEMRCAP